MTDSTKQPQIKGWHIIVASVIAILGLLTWISVDVGAIQAGIVPPTPAVLAQANSVEPQTLEPARDITAYERFDVATPDGLTISVYARESADATSNLLLVHGAGGGAWVWEHYFEQLPQNVNLYALSWRGHFDSQPVDNAFSADYVIDQQAVAQAINKRNALPLHLLGHSYGGATAVMQAAAAPKDQVASLTLLAPVVPLDYTLFQSWIVPAVAPMFIEPSLENGNDVEGTFGGMFLSDAARARVYDAYASKDHSHEFPGLIAVDGVDPNWQKQLMQAYASVAASGLKTSMHIAEFDNVVVPARQSEIASELGLVIHRHDMGHYLPLDAGFDDIFDDLLAQLN